MWSKGDINRRGSCLAAWETACKPKTKGGLGIIDTKSQNEALLMKFLDRFFNSADAMGDFNLDQILLQHTDSTTSQKSCRVFWWKEILKVFDKYQELAICTPNKGNIVLFWSDSWTD